MSSVDTKRAVAILREVALVKTALIDQALKDAMIADLNRQLAVIYAKPNVSVEGGVTKVSK